MLSHQLLDELMDHYAHPGDEYYHLESALFLFQVILHF